jgi:hypothetical protein
MRSRTLITIAAVAAILLAPSPARAETRPPSGPGGGGAYVDGGTPTATAQDGGSAPGSGSGGGTATPDPCHWEVVIDDDFKFGIYSVDTLETQHSKTGRWLQYVCPGIGAVDVNGFYLIPEGGLVDPAALAADALSSIGIAAPAIRTSPSSSGRLYVQIPTWLWLDQTWWKTYRATASAGRVTATVVARPVRTSWSPGDGSSVSCAGRGTPWEAGLPDDATDCKHTYRNSSARHQGGTFGLKASVTLEVTWTSNTGAGGALPAITRTSTLDVEVGEIQAIGTGG